MTKIVILGDIHIGSRNESLVFAEYHISFFEKQLIPYLKDNDIKTIIQLGDIFDKHKALNFHIYHMWKERVFDVLQKMGVSLYILIGNHDVYFRNDNKVNSPKLILEEFNNITIVEDIAELYFDDVLTLLVPWINASNEKRFMNFIETKSQATVCMGHFEFVGFEMDKGNKAEVGMSVKPFNHFDAVYSGHYHHRSVKGNITYTGVPYQITWSDFGSEKGFYVWDTSTNKSKFVVNKHEIFAKIVYDGEAPTLDFTTFKNKIVRVIVIKKTSQEDFENFIAELEKADTVEVKVQEEWSTDNQQNESSDTSPDSTNEILNNYIDGLTLDPVIEKSILKQKIMALYVESANNGAE